MYRILDWLGIESDRLWIMGLQIIFLPLNIAGHILQSLKVLPTYNKFYTHSFPSREGARPYCGYCGVLLEKTDIYMHVYVGQHKWWCSLKRGMRNEFIIHK